MHLGSLVAAMASFLEAKSHAGEWLVRMEDLDAPRTVPGAADGILSTLEACGMKWDCAVLRQSTRTAAYSDAFERLRERGLVYPCACSRREIADSAARGIEGQVYPGTCRNGLAHGKTVRAWRLNTHGANIRFDDGIQGPVEQHLESAIGDFVLLRADGTYAYQLAVVIDDAEQGVTDIVRGADLLDSTPRQVYLQQLLNLPLPRYSHVPVVVNARGEKLSKQTLAAPVDCARPVPALMATLRFLGQQPPNALAGASVSELWPWAIENWRIDRVPRVRSSEMRDA